MPRQEHWRTSAQAGGVAVPNTPAIPAAQVRNAWEDVWPKLNQAASAVTNFLGQQYQAEQTAAVDSALLETQRRFEQWQAAYKEEHTGALAERAGQDFASRWEELAEETAQGFGGKSHEVFQDLLRQRLAERGLYASRDGLAWQASQMNAFRKSEQEAQADGLVRFAGANPRDEAAIASEFANWQASLQARNPGLDLSRQKAAMAESITQSRLEALLLEGDTQGARQLLAATPMWQSGQGNRPGYTAAHEENGGKGVQAIGYDRNGGTSYGYWQLSSRQGSYGEWLSYLEKHSQKGAEIAAQLRAAGNPNTGSRAGQAVETYLRLAQENAELFEETQHAYLMASHYQPALDSLPRELQNLIAGDSSLQEMLFSTAVQHGGGGAGRILRSVWRAGMGREELIRSVYAKRGTQFQSSTREVQEAVRERFGREVNLMLNLPAQPANKAEARRNSFAPNPASPLSPASQQRYLQRIEAMEKQNQAQNNAAMRMVIDNFVAASEDGNILDLPFDQSQVYAAFGPLDGSQIWQRMQGAQRLAIDLGQARGMGAAGQNELLESARPDPYSPTYRVEQAHYEALARAIDGMQKSMAEDPAAYAASVNPNLASARQQFLSSMNPQTAQAYMNSLSAAYQCLDLAGPLLGKKDAQALAQWATQHENPAHALRTLVKSFGRASPQMLECLAPELSPSMSLAATMDENPGRILLQAECDKEFNKNAKLILEQRGSDAQSLAETVAAHLEPMLRTFAGTPDSRLPPAIASATQKLAVYYMGSLGMKEEKAVERAANEVILSRYAILPGAKISTGWFSSEKRPNVRVPREENA